VHTLRIDEYLQNKHLEEELKDKEELEELFPFNPDDSYYPLTDKLMVVPPRRDGIPLLDFKELPEYETSEEDAAEQKESCKGGEEGEEEKVGF